ncbi:MAG TPA: retropepsin-like aspartic protease [Chloroflexota bacterium]|nr:retropepsin-like aspartic protease [Chloroflexota bacterium]
MLTLWPLVACEPLEWAPAAQLADASESSVPLQVVRDPTGSVLVLVSVTIQDQGPFTFVVDTGASRTVIDRQLADRLQLEVLPAVPAASGISGAVEASVVRVPRWRAGDVELPGTILAAIDLGNSSSPLVEQLLGRRMDGLLGSDVLSGYGAVTIDYQRGVLVLAPGS